MRAAAYTRVSTEGQAEDDKTSLGEQILGVEQHCERKGHAIVQRYQDVGSGSSSTKRPEFQRMLADAKAGLFDVIVCWKSDRLSRGLFPAAALMEAVESRHIALEAVMDSIDIKVFGLMAAVGKIELDNLKERSIMGKRGAAKQGRIPAGGVPYGYRAGDDGKPVIHEAEAEVVRRIYSAYVSDGGGMEACLEASGLKHLSHVRRILSNSAYMGVWSYGRTKRTTTETGAVFHAQPQDTWIEIAFPPIVDAETWKQAQGLKRSRLKRSPRNTKHDYMLQHMMRCGECGLLFGGRADNRYGLLYYRCAGRAKHHSKCSHNLIRADHLAGCGKRTRRTDVVDGASSRPTISLIL